MFLLDHAGAAILGSGGAGSPVGGGLCPEDLIEAAAQGDIDIGHGDGQAHIHQTCDAMLRDAAGHDSGEMLQIRFHVDRNSVETHPFTQADPDRGDLVFCDFSGRGPRFVRAFDPDADTAAADVSGQVEFCQGTI